LLFYGLRRTFAGLARPAIIVHDLAQARAALVAAAALEVPVALRSAPGAASYLGPAVFRAIIDAARAGGADADVVAVMDCGQDAGRALSALRHGIERVRVDLPPATVARIADIATCYGAAVDDEDVPVLNLLNCPDPAAACQKWLADAAK
jgi:fructose/tagatose bisphosphate aldolase